MPYTHKIQIETDIYQQFENNKIRMFLLPDKAKMYRENDYVIVIEKVHEYITGRSLNGYRILQIISGQPGLDPDYVVVFLQSRW